MSGLWDDPKVPKSGWACVHVHDEGPERWEGEQERPTCEMCCRERLRYVHTMEHPDYPGVLEVGCVCAGHMEGDENKARWRQQSLQRAAERRYRWLNQPWHQRPNGNWVRREEGLWITVFPDKRKNGFWKFVIDNHYSQSFSTVRAAQEAAHDYLYPPHTRKNPAQL